MTGLADALAQLQENILVVEVVGLAGQQELERLFAFPRVVRREVENQVVLIRNKGAISRIDTGQEFALMQFLGNRLRLIERNRRLPRRNQTPSLNDDLNFDLTNIFLALLTYTQDRHDDLLKTCPTMDKP